MKIQIPKNEEVTNIPTDYFILVDTSGSMWYSIEYLKETILSVNKNTSPKDTLTLGYFSSYGDYDFFARGVSFNDSNLEKLVNTKIVAKGLTCYTESLEKLLDVVKDVKTISGNKNSVFYFLTDGYPNHNSSEEKIYELCEKLSSKFDSKYIVGYGQYYGRQVLLNMSSKIKGNFNHVSDFIELAKNYSEVFDTKTSFEEIDLDDKYDLVWQVNNNDIYVIEQKGTKALAYSFDTESDLYALNYEEIEKIDTNSDSRFTYSLAYVLSQHNKANLGVFVLRKVGALQDAKILQKAFTTSQKGKVENYLKEKACKKSPISKTTDSVPTILINDFISELKQNIGEIKIDIENSDYNKISRKVNYTNKVDFVVKDKKAKIVDIVENEDRANISFLTVVEGDINGVNDEELLLKINTFNKTAKKPITFPIKSKTFKNYTLVANGDWNFKKLVLETGQGMREIYPEIDLDLFDDQIEDVSFDNFVTLNKELIEVRAHNSVINFYLKELQETVHTFDLRAELYGEDAVELLKEIGLNYQMCYSPDKEYIARSEDDDYITFLEISARLKGASVISASTSYEKHTKYHNGDKVKLNAGDNICFPLFDKYDKLKRELNKEEFIDILKNKSKSLKNELIHLRHRLWSIKFYLMITNSWFEGIEKQDQIEKDGLVIKIKEEKEYL